MQENTKRRKQGKIQRALVTSQLISAMPPLEAVKVLVSIMMSVSLSNKRKPTTSAEHISMEQRLICIKLPAEDRRKYGEDDVGRLIKNMRGTHM